MPICELCLEEAHDDHYTTTINKAAQERRSTVQALISEGRNILERYCGFIKGLGEEEKTLIKQIEQNKNSIIQAYDERVQKLTEQKDQLLAEAEQSQGKNLETIGNGRDRVLRDVNELSAACDRAEQEMEQGGLVLLSQETVLTEVVGKYRVKAAPTPVQTQSAVFQPTDTPVPVLGHVMPQPLTSAAIPTVPAAKVRGQHHGNQMLGGHWCQRVTFGGEGSGTGQFNGPRAVAVSGEGEIFVVDGANQRIQVFTQQGTFVQQFPTVANVSGEQQKMYPHDVAMDGEGNLLVVGGTDSAEFAVKYNKQGMMLWYLPLYVTKWERGVAMDTRRNHILITQTKGGWSNQQGEVNVLSQVEGVKLVRIVGQQQGMMYPRGITTDVEGNILLSDWDNHCVFVYNEDGQFLFKFGGRGSGEGQMYNPHGICTDKEGNIIVADSGNSRVEMFDKTGRFLKHIATNMEAPLAVAMATQGQLVVTFWNHTVSVLQNY
ncbi:E3 ubiquitin-protein ligase TRIM71-like [Branchiostoma floridae]|uniref:E3 ubiquitin-protein ligase TRIM71-like n=2 Tax=Branchiostoma floridae TaxID=7739 RepID=A0A9J7LM88_BRAFL|nr:E3 ubiquitin-protein ligase TRIM71-like [Branchiostoma floridae]